jgi:hypothetical protein
MPSHVHTHKQAGIMALPLDGRFELKIPVLDFHPPTNNIHATYHCMNSAHDADALVIEIRYVFCTFVTTFNTST